MKSLPEPRRQGVEWGWRLRGDLPSSGKCRDVKMQEDKWDWFLSLQVIPADGKVREWPGEKRLQA